MRGRDRQLPREEVLRCDAPGCDEIGELVQITMEGKLFEVILGRDHLSAPVSDAVKWGQLITPRARASGASRPRRSTTDRRRLEALLDADNPDRAAGD
jgi:hypothetical protein